MRDAKRDAMLLAAVDFSQLDPEEQADALRLATRAGNDAVQRLSSSDGGSLMDVARPEEELRNPHRSLYYLEVIGLATQSDLVDEPLDERWRDFLSGQDSEDDPRVQAFLGAWRRRADQIIKFQTDNGIGR
jgi:hypothetical protein